MSKDLNPKKALIFRIVHRDNVPWILDHGLHCRNSATFDADYVEIGNSDLIAKRNRHPVPCAPGGRLRDYVPFYFTPFSPMLYNIKTGWGGI
jgi:ssDNA thymidine ADP-ribosyltransferase, DarT